MVQSMQNIFDKTNLAIHSAGDTSPEGLVLQVDTLKVVACPVCRAVYLPFSQQQGNERSSFTLLEAAFLRVCHFCFRCRRPACPQCWNQEHNLCAACSETAHLPFHSPLSSFEGLIFSPPILPQVSRENGTSFTCLRNGRCYASSHVSLVSESTDALLPACPSPDQGTSIISAAEHLYPAWLQEVMGQRPGSRTSKSHPKEESAIWGSDRAENPPILPHTSSPEWPQSSQLLPQVPEQPVMENIGTVLETESQEPDHEEEEQLTPIERIENVLICIVSLILAAIVIMIVLAVSSADMNALFLRFIHIDIRAEITYLLQMA